MANNIMDRGVMSKFNTESSYWYTLLSVVSLNFSAIPLAVADDTYKTESLLVPVVSETYSVAAPLNPTCSALNHQCSFTIDSSSAFSTTGANVVTTLFNDASNSGVLSLNQISCTFNNNAPAIFAGGVFSERGANNNRLAVSNVQFTYQYNDLDEYDYLINNALIGGWSLYKNGPLVKNSVEISKGSTNNIFSGMLHIVGGKLMINDAPDADLNIIENIATIFGVDINGGGARISGAFINDVNGDYIDGITVTLENNKVIINGVTLTSAASSNVKQIFYANSVKVDEDAAALDLNFNNNTLDITNLSIDVLTSGNSESEVQLIAADLYVSLPLLTSYPIAQNNTVTINNEAYVIKAPKIYICGTNINHGTATSNTVHIKTGILHLRNTFECAGANIDTYAYQGDVVTNGVIIDGGDFTVSHSTASLDGGPFLAGAYINLVSTDSADADYRISENFVKITQGNFNNPFNYSLLESRHYIIGCYLKQNTLSIPITENEVMIGEAGSDKDIVINNAFCCGAASYEAVAHSMELNKVIINGGTFNVASISGASQLTSNGSVNCINKNRVLINGGQFSFCQIIGGYATSLNTASEQEVSITGGQFILSNNQELAEALPDWNFNLIAACLSGDSNAVMENTCVKIAGDSTKLDLSGAYLCGAACFDSVSNIGLFSEDVLTSCPKNATGSKLVVATDGVTAQGCYLFDEIQFVLPGALNAASPMLTLKKDLDLNFSSGHFSKPTKITLNTSTNATKYHKGDTICLIASNDRIKGFNENETLIDSTGNFTLSLENNRIILMAQTNNDGGLLLNATRGVIANSCLVNSAMDLASNMLNQLAYSADTSSLFAASAGSNKITTGSHVKASGGNLAIGAAKSFQHLTAGVLLEGGLSHFETYEHVKLSSGNSLLGGIGALLKLDSSHAYLAASLHGGVLKTKQEFKANTSYFGAAAELGWHLGPYIDAYARYSYSRTGEIKEKVLDQELKLDPTESHRGRVGAKFSLINYLAKPYLGIAFEREFKGEVKGVVVGEDSVARPTAKGNSGVVELGAQLDLNKATALNVSAEASFGRRQSITGHIKLEFKL